MERKLKYASNGWNKLQIKLKQQKFYENALQALKNEIPRDLTGFSFHEVMCYYGEISSNAYRCVWASHMESSLIEHAEYFIALMIKAKQMAYEIVLLNPHRSQTGSKLSINHEIQIAIAGGFFADAYNLIEAQQKINGNSVLHNARQKSGSMDNEADLYCHLLNQEFEQANRCVGRAIEWMQKNPPIPIYHKEYALMSALIQQDSDLFSDALKQYIREARLTISPEPILPFALAMERLALREGIETDIDVADAPKNLLKLPSCDFDQFSEKTGLPNPEWNIEKILPKIDRKKHRPTHA